MKAFEILQHGKVFDYRTSQQLDLEKVRTFFSENYTVKKLWQESRHVLGLLEKNNQQFFLKLATTEGIGVVTQIEYKWNEEFNRLVARSSHFWVPQNKDHGFYDTLFYLITDVFTGEKLAERPQDNSINATISQYLLSIIEFSELIENLKMHAVSEKDSANYQQWFLDKTQSWYTAVPTAVANKYNIEELLQIVQNGYKTLEEKPRHGDFTPWHLYALENGAIGLIDGEHAMKSGVQYYDIGYFIQRVYTILQNQAIAQQVFDILHERNYSIEKLQVILAARAIGGFLDESLVPNPDYSRNITFKTWVLKKHF